MEIHEQTVVLYKIYVADLNWFEAIFVSNSLINGNKWTHVM